jgi:hypothetical protein
MVFLVDYSNYSKVVDDDTIEVLAYRVGDYSYSTTHNSTRTVRKFSASLDAATRWIIAQKTERKQSDAVENQSASYNYEGPARLIAGKVLQKLPNGLLVDSGVYEMPSDGGGQIYSGERVYHGKAIFFLNSPSQYDEAVRRNRYVGLVLLVDFSRYSDAVDDDLIKALAYPVGEYSYTTSQGAQKTIRKFSAKPR